MNYITMANISNEWNEIDEYLSIKASVSLIQFL